MCTFTEFKDQFSYHELECQSSVVELLVTYFNHAYLLDS